MMAVKRTGNKILIFFTFLILTQNEYSHYWELGPKFFQNLHLENKIRKITLSSFFSLRKWKKNEKCHYIYFFNFKKFTASCSRICNCPGITRECKGLPKSILSKSFKGAATIFWSSCPTLATPIAMLSSLILALSPKSRIIIIISTGQSHYI